MKDRFRFSVAAIAIAALILSGCAATTFKTKSHLDHGTADLRILLMPMDIELSLLTAGGVPEPNAEWTAKAQKHVLAAVTRILKERHAHLIAYKAPPEAEDPLHPYVQLVKLHSAVGKAVILHKINPVLQLPTKTDTFDWSLGQGVRRLKKDFGADYALFVFMRDSYTSAGRAVAMFLAAALIGAHIPGGQQTGFASLVDLNTGDIVWFNVLARGSGDLRTPADANETVAKLFNDLPK